MKTFTTVYINLNSLYILHLSCYQFWHCNCYNQSS